MTTTSTQSGRPARNQTSSSSTRRPIYLVTHQRSRPQKYHKRHISELPKALRVAATFFIGSCLGWFVLVIAGLITFLFLFIRVASMVLPELLAHLP